jgi:S1-C subfamily serine protease
MSFIEKYEEIERYLQGLMPPAEQQAFEEKLRQNPALRQEVENQRLLIESLQQHGKRIKLKAQLEQFHREIEAEQPALQKKTRLQLAWQRYAPMLAVAASLALIVVSTMLWNIRNLNSLENQQISYYKALKKDIDKVKETQKDLAAQQQAVAQEKLPKTPANHTATAFAISREGWLVTNYHVVRDARLLLVEAKAEANAAQLQVEVIYKDEAHDLAILRINDSSFVPFKNIPFTLRTEVADLGEEVFTLAYPREDLVYGQGSISSKTGFEGDTVAYQVSIPVNPGNSGSPLLDEKGNLIGIISGKSTAEDGATYAIKAKYIQALLERIMQEENKESNFSFPRFNQIQYLKRPQQIKQLQSYIFELKVYSKDKDLKE